MSAKAQTLKGFRSGWSSPRMKGRIPTRFVSVVLTSMVLTACQGGDSTGPSSTLFWSSVSSGTTANLFGVWGASPSDVCSRRRRDASLQRIQLVGFEHAADLSPRHMGQLLI
jgi:hypothetical protein